MGSGFRFEINVEPKDIPNLDDSHKRDCADAVARAVDRVFKYTMIFCAAAVIFFAAYSFFSMNYMMRTMQKPPQITPIIPAAAILCCVFEFIAGTMQRWAIVLEIILMALILAASLILVPTMWMIPFAAYGILEHIKLFLVYPFYKVISEQKGYPEFTPLPTKDEIVLRKSAEDTSGGSKDDEKVSEPVKLEKPVEPEEASEPVKLEKPAESEEASEPVKLEKPAEPEEASEPVKLEKPAEPEKKAAAQKPSGSKKKKSKSRRKK